MITSFVITFRETLEAALIVGIILSYLIKTKQVKFINIVYVAIAAGIVASIFGAILFNVVAGGFEGTAEKLFEGVIMLIGAALLTTMIFWMMKQKHLASELRHKVADELDDAHKFGIFSLVFIAILREGIETVIFLASASYVTGENSMIGAILGIAVAIVLGYVIYVGSTRINIKKFFNVTSIILILFAAGLVAHGLHELQEAGVVPIVVEHVWDINPPENADGTFPLLHENGHVGSIFKGLLGYNGNPSLLEVISYLIYLVLIFFVWRRVDSTQGK